MVKMVDEKGKIKFYEDDEVVLTYDLGKKAFIGVSGREITIRTARGARYRDILDEISYQAFKDKNTSKEDFFSHAFLYTLLEEPLDLDTVVAREKYYRVGVPFLRELPLKKKYIEMASNILEEVFLEYYWRAENSTSYYYYLTGTLKGQMTNKVNCELMKMECFPEGLGENLFVNQALEVYLRCSNSFSIPKKELRKFFSWLEKHTKRFYNTRFDYYNIGFAKDVFSILKTMSNEKLYTTPGFEYQFNNQLLPHELSLEKQRIENRISAIEASVFQREMEEYIKEYKDILNYQGEEYIVIMPENFQEYIKEAEYQRNCLANSMNYFKKAVTQGKHILFLRRKDNPNKSVATIELTSNLLIQQFNGFANRYFREDSPERRFFIEEYLPIVRRRMGMIGF